MGQICSISGTNAQTVAVGWLILQLTDSGMVLGAVTAAQFLPLLVFAPLLGPVIDRHWKKQILVVTQVLALVVALLLWILTATEVVNAWTVAFLALLLGAVNAVDNPARQSFIKELVGADVLPNALALNNVLFGVARILGPAVAAVIIATAGLAYCFLFNALSFLVILGALLSMSVPRPKRISHATTFRSLVDGFRYVGSTPEVRDVLIVMAFVGVFTYEFWVTLPVLVKNVFHGGSSTYAAMLTVMSVGSILGGLLIARHGSAARNQRVLAIAGFGLTTALVGFAPSIETALIAVFFMGIAYSAFTAIMSSALQLQTDGQFRGRVMALWTSAFMGSTAIGGPIVGAIAEYAGARFALIVGGVVAVAVAIWVRMSRTAKEENWQSTAT